MVDEIGKIIRQGLLSVLIMVNGFFVALFVLMVPFWKKALSEARKKSDLPAERS